MINQYLEDFDQSKYIMELRRKLAEIETLRFIGNKENIILIGGLRTGKTHYWGWRKWLID